MVTLAGLLVAGCGDEGDGNGSAGSDTAAANSEPAPSADSNSEESAAEGSVEPGGQSAGDTGTTSKANFLKEGNAICQQTVTNITQRALPPYEEQEKTGDKTRREVELELVETIAVPELLNEIDELEGLGTPPGEEAEVRRVLASFLDVVEEAKEDPRVLAGTNQAFAEPAKVAESYGLDNCPYG